MMKKMPSTLMIGKKPLAVDGGISTYGGRHVIGCARRVRIYGLPSKKITRRTFVEQAGNGTYRVSSEPPWDSDVAGFILKIHRDNRCDVAILEEAK